jgi:hypothetical protein
MYRMASRVATIGKEKKRLNVHFARKMFDLNGSQVWHEALLNSGITDVL